VDVATLNDMLAKWSDKLDTAVLGAGAMPSDTPQMKVKLYAHAVPAAEGECSHDRAVVYNLSVHNGDDWPERLGSVIHQDDDSRCDGDLVIDGVTGWR
jgi:hypothetical protein